MCMVVCCLVIVCTALLYHHVPSLNLSQERELKLESVLSHVQHYDLDSLDNLCWP